jgi:glucoamylase
LTGLIAPPGAPGIPPSWTSIERQERGGACRESGLVHHQPWHSRRAGRLDTACIRDFGFIVTAKDSEKDYFSEEKRDTHQSVEMIEDGVPAFRLVNTSIDGCYRITKIVFSDPLREVVLQQIHFEALIGTLADYRLIANGGRAVLTIFWPQRNRWEGSDFGVAIVVAA